MIATRTVIGTVTGTVTGTATGTVIEIVIGTVIGIVIGTVTKTVIITEDVEVSKVQMTTITIQGFMGSHSTLVIRSLKMID